ncbi:hypothetical protein BCR39DRAFT_518185 [Naematelia encephala]|uniref:Glycosyltransferase family 32 protein n=1 Tax=Naematelia encephala TaxID=71784 RepID=A0A1Y2BGU4_9TREE|nr:hypothetical protein BCR39DRAFT_518185 [Naematelia encephala]
MPLLLLTSRQRTLVVFLLVLLPAVVFTFVLWRTSNPVYAFSRGRLGGYTSVGSRCFWSPQRSDDGFTGNLGHETAGSVTSDDADVIQDALPSVIPTSGIEAYMRAHLQDLSMPYDASKALKAYGLKLGDISLTGYTAELLSTFRTYLHSSSSSTPHYLQPILSRLSLRPPTEPLPDRPRQILTTDKRVNIDDLPVEFALWKIIMPDWEVKCFDDKGLEKWVREAFGGTRAEEVWMSLPRQVLKTDLFRYMAMLVEGGIYTDSDTAPIIHADLWGYPYEDATPPLLTHLSRLLSLSTTPHHLYSATEMPPGVSAESDEQGASQIYDGPLVDDGAELGPPGLVVSVESDAISFSWDNWREIGLSRAVQITQWTFMARPGHPVFLDALGRTLRKTEEIAKEIERATAAGEEYLPETALEWTGPGVFSDCVYRYLLARYGFTPEHLIHQEVPIRVGDVLILPAGSFSSVSPLSDEKQRDWAASYHGFKGRWRQDDPVQQKLKKLTKLKKEAEVTKSSISKATKPASQTVARRSERQSEGNVNIVSRHQVERDVG